MSVSFTFAALLIAGVAALGLLLLILLITAHAALDERPVRRLRMSFELA